MEVVIPGLVAYITAMAFHLLIFSSSVQIYVFHVFHFQYVISFDY